MKQLVQFIRTGKSVVVEVPVAKVRTGHVLVRVGASAVSAGTERMVVDFARKNLVQKAMARPDLVRQVIEKSRREGIVGALEAVQVRMDQPMALGYSCAGVIVAVGEQVDDLHVGDRVACAGGGFATHSEFASIPNNLAVRLPESVSIDAGAFATLGAIALHGLRLADIKLGEVVGVIGLGVLGQFSVQMAKAAGCRVIGMDLRQDRVAMALQQGADAAVSTVEEFITLAHNLSSGRGADAIVITADTVSNEPLATAGEAARNKGVVVAVGAIGTSVPRKLYYEKELDFRISRSYGPGRYDPAYEEQGHDYPHAYVRWTERRNMEAFVALAATGGVRVEPLVSHRFPIEDAAQAYDLISAKTGEASLGVMLTYADDQELRRVIEMPVPASTSKRASALGSVRLGVLGAGNFATGTMLPMLRHFPDVTPVGIASANGVATQGAASRFGFKYCTSDSAQVLADTDINVVAVLTRHHQHASQIVAALKAGKHVFAEKPLCLTLDELDEIRAAYDTAQQATPAPILMCGFNRRFAPMAKSLKAFLAPVHEPLVMHYRVNAGFIPLDHWVHDPHQGGGRLLGEGCHFIDFLMFLSGAVPSVVRVRSLPNLNRYRNDNLVIEIDFNNGSLGSITYVANGDKAFGKERVEVFGGGRIAVLEDFRSLELVHDGRRSTTRSRWRQDKGHRGGWEAFIAAVKSGSASPIPFTELVESARATINGAADLLQRERHVRA